MACNVNSINLALGSSLQPNPQPCSSSLLFSSNLNSNSITKCPKLILSSQSSFNSTFFLCLGESLLLHPSSRLLPPNASKFQAVGSAKVEPPRIMISGAPASGKGTQCQLITHKYDLVHIAAGDLLRAEVAAGTENGKRAREYMDKGQLVPDEIVVMMVKDRLSQQDSLEKGWLLDGYPRSSSQAIALKEFGFEPDLFILLEVPEDILVERVVGRRLDPVTGKIYHLTYSPPETEEIASRLTQRFDDTEEKVKLRLLTHNQNVEAVLSMYKDITVKIKGNVSKEEVFVQIDVALKKLLEQKKKKQLQDLLAV